MSSNHLEVNGERLWETLEVSGEIGKYRETGLRRLALTQEDKQMRDDFVDWCKDAGCTVEVDHLGNIFATRRLWSAGVLRHLTEQRSTACID